MQSIFWFGYYVNVCNFIIIIIITIIIIFLFVCHNVIFLLFYEILSHIIFYCNV